MNKLLFFCIASAILLFSIITINISPIIHGLLDGNSWMESSCKYLSDIYDIDKDAGSNKEKLDSDKKDLDRCNRKQAMVGLEYTSLNINIIIGFICALLGFLHYLNLGNLGKIPGLIGIGGGIVAFVLTLVYVIESGLIFNDIVDSSTPRIDSDGAVLEWDGGKYVCIFYKEDNKDSVLLKYSDYGNKYLSYIKEMYFHENDDKQYKDLNNNGCNCYNNLDVSSTNPFYVDAAGNTDKLEVDYDNCQKMTKDGEMPKLKSKINDCDKIVYINPTTDNSNKILYDHWLTSIILSCLIFLLDIGLALFGFLLFKESGSSSGSIAIK